MKRVRSARQFSGRSEVRSMECSYYERFVLRGTTVLQSLLEESTGDYIIIYGKVVQSSVPKKVDSEYETSMANITNKLKGINRVDKEQEFREANKLPK